MNIDEKNLENAKSHYSRHGLHVDILSKVKSLNNCSDNKKIEKLFKYDQFHIGGHVATQKMLDLLDGLSGGQVLDVGGGFGGVARFLAHYTGNRVFSLDLTQDYVESAKIIDVEFGFSDRVEHFCGDICDFAFGRCVFDAAVWGHVGMNIKNKDIALSNVSNALKQNGKLIIYDVLLSEGFTVQDIPYPVPWAPSSKCSHIEDLKSYENNLLEAGFKVMSAVRYGEIIPKIVDNPVPDDVISFTGSDFKLCLENLRSFLAQGMGAPWFIVAEKI